MESESKKTNSGRTYRSTSYFQRMNELTNQEINKETGGILK